MCSGEKNLAIENCEANSAMNSGHGPQLNLHPPPKQFLGGGLTTLVPVHMCMHSLVQYSILHQCLINLRGRFMGHVINICQQTGHMYGEQLSEKAWQKEIVFKFCNLNLSRTDLL